MKLLHIEWLKLRKYKTFWLLVSLFGGIFLLWNYAINNSFLKLGSGPVNLLSSSYSFPAVWANMGYIYSWFVLFLAVFVIISVSNEFTFRTNRQHIIDGMRRIDFLHSKALLVLSMAIGATLFYALTAFVFGLCNGGGNPLQNMETVVYVFLYTLNYLAFAGLISFFIKRSGLSIILLLAYLLFETIIVNVVNHYFGTFVGNLMPLQSTDELLPLPVWKSLAAMTSTVTHDTPIYLSIVFGIGYIAIYYSLLRYKMLKTDL